MVIDLKKSVCSGSFL